MPRFILLVTALLLSVGLASCSKQADAGLDDKITKFGSIEITAKLVEVIPFNETCTFPANDLYDYVYVFKYQVLQRHRGGKDVPDVLYVGHYNPLKLRVKAADARVEGIGGDLRQFRTGDVHRMALEPSLDDHYMGPIINKYHGKHKGPIYWAVWTNRVRM